jgi:hypothetical protein
LVAVSNIYYQIPDCNTISDVTVIKSLFHI